MRNTRILLFLSPVILFIRSILPPWNRSLAWGLIGFFFSRLLRTFIWNVLMAVPTHRFEIFHLVGGGSGGYEGTP